MQHEYSQVGSLHAREQRVIISKKIIERQNMNRVALIFKLRNLGIQGVSAKTFEPNNSVIFQRIFVKFKMQIF
jgi:hypothetical protein